MRNTSVDQISQRQPACTPQLPSDTPSISVLKARQCAKIAEFRVALVASGFTSLDAQTAALGLSRSSTWAILNRNYKASGLSSTIINRIMCSPQLPASAKEKLEQYVQEKLAGKYGHPPIRLRLFRKQLLACPGAPVSNLQRSRLNASESA
jgi:hypothetical protein